LEILIAKSKIRNKFELTNRRKFETRLFNHGLPGLTRIRDYIAARRGVGMGNGNVTFCGTGLGLVVKPKHNNKIRLT
jgi:hypothetical protein